MKEKARHPNYPEKENHPRCNCGGACGLFSEPAHNATLSLASLRLDLTVRLVDLAENRVLGPLLRLI